MLFLAEIVNKTGIDDLHKANRDAHIEYLKKTYDAVRAAANLKDSLDGETTGIVWIIEAPDKAAAERVVKDDPFYTAGLRQSVTVRHFVKSVDRPATI